jgi:hypothetical protein
MTPRVGPGSGHTPLSPSAPVSPGGAISPLNQGNSGEQSYFSLPRKYSGSSGSGTFTGPSTPWEDDPNGPGPTRRRRGSSSASQSQYKSPISTADRHHARKPSLEHQGSGMALNFGGAMLPPQQGSVVTNGYEHMGYLPMPPTPVLSGSAPGAGGRIPAANVEYTRWSVELMETATW